ncbi:unnamed protein product [Adineta steineri]|uniref:Uncharacterized protein n=1 Tax=Adineta steineri TaxID=433720 RepID=A0A819HU95_9BILA|nr:unnamed protein product [Adineta steineri]CAF0986627.1 unnamed protein product [Adineta steineri]CAF3905738.1 unnamed protein product [Adineta steineri]CAF4055074.1 unnamed protein product [Adineta steineri]
MENEDNAVFSGYAGGYDSVPGVGIVPPAGIPLSNIGANGNYQIEANSGRVDPNNFPGVVHWGPEQAVSTAELEQIIQRRVD